MVHGMKEMTQGPQNISKTRMCGEKNKTYIELMKDNLDHQTRPFSFFFFFFFFFFSESLKEDEKQSSAAQPLVLDDDLSPGRRCRCRF